MSWPWRIVSCLRPFYYNKYYKKTFNVKHYGVETNLALLSYIKDGSCEHQLGVAVSWVGCFTKKTFRCTKKRER